MSGDVIPHPAAPLLPCDFCLGSPINQAAHNIEIELEGCKRFKGRTWRFQVHVCKPCRREFFKPVTPGLVRLDDLITFELLKGTFTLLPARRLQRKRR